MDIKRKQQDHTLVCTCSDLYTKDIEEAILQGEDDYIEIMQYHYTLSRCGECEEHVAGIVKQSL